VSIVAAPSGRRALWHTHGVLGCKQAAATDWLVSAMPAGDLRADATLVQVRDDTKKHGCESAAHDVEDVEVCIEPMAVLADCKPDQSNASSSSAPSPRPSVDSNSGEAQDAVQAAAAADGTVLVQGTQKEPQLPQQQQQEEAPPAAQLQADPSACHQEEANAGTVQTLRQASTAPSEQPPQAQLQDAGLQRLLAAESAAEPPSGEGSSAVQMPTSPLQQAALRRTLTSRSSQRLARPAAINNEALLRLLAEAYGHMMADAVAADAPSRDAASAAMSEDDVERWLKQLLALSVHPGSNTVAALHRSLRDDHSWLRLSDVYSALLYLRQKYGGVQEAQE
jgi:hypothetical protein